jgi:hypothetical protein
MRSRRLGRSDASEGQPLADLAARLERRLARVEAMLFEIVQTDRERRLLHAIADATRATTFSVAELLAFADKSPRLSAEIAGWSRKRVGRLLARSVGLTGAIEVRRIGDADGAALWVCLQKARLPVDASVVPCDVIGIIRTTPTNETF